LVTKSIASAGTYSGVFPLQENRAWSRTAVLLRNIDSLEDRISALERILASIQEKE
jgi:UDP-3-O-[3-hydroxymyristoyl] glucosamine N-acyltransferase